MAVRSKRTEELVRYVAQRCRPSLVRELGEWVEDNARFAAFVEAHRDKIRKKLTVTDDEEHRLAVRAELLVAARLLADRRFDVAFEAYGTGRVGPDLSVSFRVNQRFNLEVTRLRAESELGVERLANVLAAKLRQLVAEVPNAVVLASSTAGADEALLTAAMRSLKAKSDATRGFDGHYVRLGGVFLLGETGAAFVASREARHPLPKEALAALIACLNQ